MQLLFLLCVLVEQQYPLLQSRTLQYESYSCFFLHGILVEQQYPLDEGFTHLNTVTHTQQSSSIRPSPVFRLQTPKHRIKCQMTVNPPIILHLVINAVLHILEMSSSRSKVRIFKESWCLKHGLEISERCPTSDEVMTAKCLFCERFGKDASEQENVRKRKRSRNISYFRPPWRIDNIQKHMKDQHSVKYAEYLEAPEEIRKSFFDSTGITFSPLDGADNDGLRMLVDKKIVERIIGGMLLDVDSDDENLNSSMVAMLIFQSQEDNYCEGVDPNSGRYLVVVPNPLLLTLFVKYMSSGLSLGECLKLLLDVKKRADLHEPGCINMQKVITYSRFVCAMAYQMISDILKSVWAFSIALEGGNNSDNSYLDVRIRFSVNEVLYNLHLVALPIREHNTGQYMFKIISDLLDALCENWKAKLIGITSDGTSSMTGPISSVVTQLHQIRHPGCYRVWCAAHEMDLVVQKIFRRLCNDSFVSTVIGIIGHLRRQQNMISEMKSKCPRFVDTRWLSMQKILTWLVAKRPRLQRHFDEKTPTCAPRQSFWIIVYVLKAFVETVNRCLVAIQGLSPFLSEQKKRLENLVIDLIEGCNVEGPYIFQSDNYSVVSGNYRVSYENAELFIKDQDIFVANLLQNLRINSPDEYKIVLQSTAFLFAESVNGLSRMIAERNVANEATDCLPPVLPQDLVRISPYEFSQIVETQKNRLMISFTEEQIVCINNEFKLLRAAYRGEEGLRRILDMSDHKTTFTNGWKLLVDRIPLLCQFAGGLASVFPRKTRVESDCSVIGWKKDEYCTALTNFSLEGILHCKQYEHLKDLSKIIDDH